MKKNIIIVLLLLSYSIAYSQKSDYKLIDKLIKKGILTEEEAKDILDDTEHATPEGPLTSKDWESIKNLINNKYLQLGGYAQLLYTYNSTKEVKHNGSIRTTFLSIRGEPIDKLQYLIFANLRNPSLTEYHVTWALLDELQFKVGQQKVPLSIENQLSISVLEFIQRARTVDYLIGGSYDVITPYNGSNSVGRDIGIKTQGNLFKRKDRSLVEYGIGIYQGSGINKNTSRSNKDFIANSLISPFEGFRIGGGVQFGQAKYSLEEEIFPSVHVRNRWIVSSDYRNDNFYARAEWINGSDGGIKKEGVYGMYSWAFVPSKWVLLGRVDYYNNDKDLNKEVIDYSAGINFLIGKACRLQTNYTYSDYNRNWGDKNSSMVEVQFQIIY